MSAPALFAACLPAAYADPIPVHYQQGSAHGFVELTTLAGQRIALGDLVQRATGRMVTSRLTFKFLDGSVDDDTVVYSQRNVFRLISDHHIQRGPSFPAPSDTLVDARTGTVAITGQDGKTSTGHIDVPADAYNGMVSMIVSNLGSSAAQAKFSTVIALSSPRLATLLVEKGGTLGFKMGGVRREAQEYILHVKLGLVAGVVAPLLGKEPQDYHLWILTHGVAAFIREEGQLFPGGPIWRIQQISAVFDPDSPTPARTTAPVAPLTHTLAPTP